MVSLYNKRIPIHKYMIGTFETSNNFIESVIQNKIAVFIMFYIRNVPLYILPTYNINFLYIYIHKRTQGKSYILHLCIFNKKFIRDGVWYFLFLAML